MNCSNQLRITDSESALLISTKSFPCRKVCRLKRVPLWNSYGYDNLDRSATLENPAFSFYTAWSAPHPIIEKLAESYPEVSFEHEWADEDIGMNCGRKTYEHGECTDTYYPEAKEAEIFANNLWGYETDTEMTEEQTL